MSTGSVTTPASISGSFEPLRTNFFCGSCRSFVQAPLGASAMRECPTPECSRPTEFGVFAKTPRPRIAVRIPAP
jgi:LSD1 subclass zinc finger protein